MLLGGSLLVACSGCAVVDVQTQQAPLKRSAKWALLPILDYSESTQAGARIEDTLSSLLQTRMQIEMAKYPAPTEADSAVDLDDRLRYQKAYDWAKKEGFSYGIGGSVNEWRYRNGADGEAAVGLTLRIVDLGSGQTLWSATGARSGFGRESASGTAQRLLRDMLGKLDVHK